MKSGWEEGPQLKAPWLPLLLGSLGSLGRPCRHRPSGSLGSFLCNPRHFHHHHRQHSHPYQHHDQNKYSQQHCYTNLNMLLEYPNTTSVLFFLFFVAPLSQKLWQNFCQSWNTNTVNLSHQSPPPSPWLLFLAFFLVLLGLIDPPLLAWLLGLLG